MAPSRNALTLTELLVIIVVIVILLGLLLPAINSPRGPSRRRDCSVKLKNLSLAAIQYENSHEEFPGWVNDFGIFGGAGELSDPTDLNADPKTLAQHRKIGTWAVAILPWLDAQPTYEIWTEDRYPVVGGGSKDHPLTSGYSGEGYTSQAAPNIAIMQCPSSTTEMGESGRNSYIANTGVFYSITKNADQERDVFTPDGEPVAMTFVDSLGERYGVFNSKLVARLPGDADRSKPSAVGPPIGIDDFKDGQGMTVLFSESLYALPWHRSGFTDSDDLVFRDDPNEVAYPANSRYTNGMVWHSVDWRNGGIGRDIHHINGPVPSGDPFSVIVRASNVGDLARPSSAHAEGVNVSMADGGTRFVSDTIDLRVWQSMLTPAGRESPEQAEF